MRKWIAVYLLLLGTLGASVGQIMLEDSTAEAVPEKVPQLTLRGHYGTLFAHSQDVQNTAGARPVGLHAELGQQWYGAETWRRFGCFPRTGLALAYYHYDNRILGQGLTAAYYLEPTFPISRRLVLGARGAAGVSWLSNPYHPERNPANMSYSTALSAYLALGLSTYYRFQEQWAVTLMVDYQHVSNGGFKQPNKGINWPTIGLGLDYTLEPLRLVRPPRGQRAQEWREAPPRRDVYLFGGVRNVASGETRRYVLGGGGVTYSRQVSNINSLTAGVEAYGDWALREQLVRDSLTDRSHVRVGAMVGHEFLLGKIIFSQQLGVYVFKQVPYYSRLYHRWGLLYRINRSLSAGVNLKAHSHVANFWDLRLVTHW
ncbi:hypothetical protein GCM10027275_23460 [Rhabdobacter roseus]|uniref:Acyloxyacyl hydrolase n=1 Tax=Rhabdobacter roseus TaxID=1655419 RepID=A0A840TJA9_9BACT|nr:acyloxyacyl hydrolase [Rhabdobacter roseus]MBB5284286.1 hypothetical protein [Rhabdobacter roseus]